MTSESFDGASGENAAWTYATSGNAVGQLTQAAKANNFARTLAYNAQRIRGQSHFSAPPHRR